MLRCTRNHAVSTLSIEVVGLPDQQEKCVFRQCVTDTRTESVRSKSTADDMKLKCVRNGATQMGCMCGAPQRPIAHAVRHSAALAAAAPAVSPALSPAASAAVRRSFKCMGPHCLDLQNREYCHQCDLPSSHCHTQTVQPQLKLETQHSCATPATTSNGSWRPRQLEQHRPQDA